MNTLVAILNKTVGKLFRYKFALRTVEEMIDEEIKEKTGDGMMLCSKRAIVHGTARLIERAKESLVIKINHRDHVEMDVMGDSYVYSALHDACERGVNINIILTREAYRKLFHNFLAIGEAFISVTNDFPSSMDVDGARRKIVNSEDGKTAFWFCSSHRK